MFAIERQLGSSSVCWWQEDDGSFWITAEELGKKLGYKEGDEKRSVLRLASRNTTQLEPFRSVVSLTTESGPRETTIFEEHGAWILAMKARTPKAEEVQLHIAQLMTRFRRGDMIVFNKSEFEQRERDRNDLITVLQERLQASEGAFRKVASIAGSALSHWRHNKPVDDNPLQKKFPFAHAKRVLRDSGGQVGKH